VLRRKYDAALFRVVCVFRGLYPGPNSDVLRIQIIRRVEFSETDMAGIMHFSNFSSSRRQPSTLFSVLGLSVVLSRNGFALHLPRVRAEAIITLHF
jgi:hypothetical protein